jgi:GNAT superfamily N-acetyltransferase
MNAAEQWARGQGYERMRLRSNVVRSEAHGFYEALGYKCSKTSRVFEKREE